MADYTIEQPIVSDAEELIAMHSQSWIDTYPNEEHGITLDHVQGRIDQFTSDEGYEKRRNYIREGLENPDYYLRIARNIKGKIVGFVDARRGKEGIELCGMYVDKSEHGKGVALLLAKGAMQWLGDEADVILNVVIYNKRAQAFYQKLGFEIIPDSVHFHNNTVIPVINMIRKGEKQ